MGIERFLFLLFCSKVTLLRTHNFLKSELHRRGQEENIQNSYNQIELVSSATSRIGDNSKLHLAFLNKQL